MRSDCLICQWCQNMSYSNQDSWLLKALPKCWDGLAGQRKTEINSLSKHYSPIQFNNHNLLTFRSQPINIFTENILLLTRLGSFKIYKTQHDPNWDSSSPYLFPATAVAKTKKKNIIKMYLIQAGKFVGFSLIFVAVALALHIGYLVSGWVWANLTFKLVLVIYVIFMGLFLSLFRP